MMAKVVEIPLTEVEIKEVQVLRLEPDDALLFRTDRAITEAAADKLMAQLSQWTRGTFGRPVKCIILEEGARVEILRSHDVPVLEERH